MFSRCECCGEEREVKLNESGVILCDECRELYSEDPTEYLFFVQDEPEEHYRAEGW